MTGMPVVATTTCHLSTTAMTDLRIIARCILMLAGAAASSVTLAQVMAPSAAASAAAEKAQKETDRTMYWIRVLAATPAAKPAAKPAAAAPAPAPVQQAKAAAPERAKVAAAAPTQSSVDVANAAPASVVVAVPAATAPSLAAANGTASVGRNSAMTSGGLDAGVASAGLGGGIAAPTMASPQIDVPVADEEPDPGLIMVKSADPEFPIATMRRLRKGEVEVKFEVGPDGVVDVVTVMKTTSPSLNAAAVDAVRRWRFKPTPKGHTAMVDLAFNLDT